MFSPHSKISGEITLSLASPLVINCTRSTILMINRVGGTGGFFVSYTVPLSSQFTTNNNINLYSVPANSVVTISVQFGSPIIEYVLTERE